MAADSESWTLLYRDFDSVALVRDGNIAWELPMNDSGLSAATTTGDYFGMNQFDDYLILNAKVPGSTRSISLIETATGEEKDLLRFGTDVIGFEMIAPGLFSAIQRNGDIVLMGYDVSLTKFKELTIIPSERALAASDVLWIREGTSTERNGFGVLVILDSGNGIVNLQALGYRDFSEEGNAQWIVESQSRGLGTNAFQTPVA